MQKSILWQGLYNDTEEHCAVNFLDKGIMVRAEIEGWAESMPVYAEYVIKLDGQWNVLEFDISFHVNDTQHSYHMSRDASGSWADKDGRQYPEFSKCLYIDISLTPFTNTLPINGLQLAENEKSEFDLIYIDILKNEIRKDRQSYTRLNKHTYRFENDSTNFRAEITVDDTGFVTHYPQLFEMVQPK
jgi:hypothetical protein